MVQPLIDLDIALFWAINAANSPAMDVVLGTVTHLGSGFVVTPLLLAVIALKRPAGGTVGRVVLAGALAIAVSGVINTQIIKRTVKRYRPVKYFSVHGDRVPERVSTNEECWSGGCVHVVGKPLRYRSFPSGHTNTAFSAATVLIMLYGGWAWIALIPAALVGYSRIYVGAHFPLDVVVGAMLGVGITWFVFTTARSLLHGGPGGAEGGDEPPVQEAVRKADQ